MTAPATVNASHTGHVTLPKEACPQTLCYSQMTLVHSSRRSNLFNSPTSWLWGYPLLEIPSNLSCRSKRVQPECGWTKSETRPLWRTARSLVRLPGISTSVVVLNPPERLCTNTPGISMSVGSANGAPDLKKEQRRLPRSGNGGGTPLNPYRPIA